MKNFFVILLLMISIPLFSSTKSELVTPSCAEEELRLCYPVEVKHFFTHALVAYPEIGFQDNNTMRESFMRDCLTVTEFKSILTSLYERGYALVDIRAMYAPTESGVELKPFYFPSNKKPVVFSFDDVNYYQKKMHMGMNDKLIVSGGKLATYTENAAENINYDNETVTVLENFISEHPDFSYNGARGILCLTGYDGILGWRTQKSAENRAEEIGGAREVVSLLKASNWRFASHSYGHGHMRTMSESAFLSDAEKWDNEVRPIVGDTDLYCYPYGEWEISENGEYSKKHLALTKRGFKLYFGVGADGYLGYAPIGKTKATATIMDRLPLDGYSLTHFSQKYADYFDCAGVFSATERKIDGV